MEEDTVGWLERSGNPAPSGNVFVTQRIPEAGIDLLRKHCEIVEVNSEDRVLKKDELIRAIKGRDGVLCLLTDRIDGEVLESARRRSRPRGGVKGFANYAVGYDNIDVRRASELGILVTNTPGVLTDATADLAWALMFAAARRIVEGDRMMRAGEFHGWAPMLLLGADITEGTLGIVGAGRIGSEVALRSVGFRMRVLYCDTRRNEEIERAVGAQLVDLHTLLAESDFVSLHIPLTRETHHVIGAREFEVMKPTAVLVNTSRGAVIDEAALVEALRRRRIAAAGLDVYEDEPHLTPGLSELTNVVLSPHVGSATVATRTRMAVMAAENLIAILEGRRPPNLVTP